MISLDDKVGAGTHWVALNMKNVAIECFDTFGLDWIFILIKQAAKITKLLN